MHYVDYITGDRESERLRDRQRQHLRCTTTHLKATLMFGYAGARSQDHETAFAEVRPPYPHLKVTKKTCANACCRGSRCCAPGIPAVTDVCIHAYVYIYIYIYIYIRVGG
jgi:hypothetical protein